MDNAAIMITSLDAVVEKALKHYDFSDDATVSLVNVSENTTYKIEDRQSGRAAALRIHRPNYHTAAEIESELLWLDGLRRDGVVEPPKALLTHGGRRLSTVEVDGGPPRHVVAFDWMSGEAPSADGDLGPSFEVLGSLAAQMHMHGQQWELPTGFSRYTCDYDAALGPRAMWGRWQDGLGLGAEESAILGRADEEVRQHLLAYGKSASRFGLSHNDLRLANLLIDGEHVHVIDFDDCGFSWFLYDFATAVSFIEDDPRVGDLMAAWLHGYRMHRHLTDEDVAIIPTLILMRRLLLVGWVGSHHEYAREAAELGADFTRVSCELAEAYLSGNYLA